MRLHQLSLVTLATLSTLSLAQETSSGGHSVSPSPSQSPISPHELTTLLLRLSDSLQNYQVAKPAIEASLNGNVTLALNETKKLKASGVRSKIAMADRITKTLESLPHSSVATNGARRKRETVQHVVSCDTVESFIVEKMLVQQSLQQEVLAIEVVVSKLRTYVAALRGFSGTESLAALLKTIATLEIANLQHKQTILELVSRAIAALESFKTQCIEPPVCVRFRAEIEPILTTALNDSDEIVAEGYSEVASMEFSAMTEKKKAADGYVSEVRRKVGDVLRKLFVDVATVLGINGSKLQRDVEGGHGGSGLYLCAYKELKESYDSVIESIKQLEQMSATIMEEDF